jgi:hypothetical protein
VLLGGCASQESTEPAQMQTPAAPPQVEDAQTKLAQLRRQASAGDLESQFQLGSFYFAGQPQKDLKQAEYWWKQAADKGHGMAAVSLAYLYTGRDNPDFANRRDMLKYLNQSAAGGNPMAQHILGNLYLKGELGVPRDPNQAKALFQSACKQNYAVSCAAQATLP